MDGLFFQNVPQLQGVENSTPKDCNVLTDGIQPQELEMVASGLLCLLCIHLISILTEFGQNLLCACREKARNHSNKA